MREYAVVDDELIKNPAPRCACVLVLDTSESMEGEAIERLNAGVKQFFDELGADEIARHSVEVAIVTFGGAAKTILDFKSYGQTVVPRFSAAGTTPMGDAVDLALKTLSARLMQYEAAGVSRYRPLIILMTDGQPTDGEGNPTDEYKPSAAKLRAGASRGHRDPTGVQVRCIAIGDHANTSILAEFCVPDSPPIRIAPGEFGKLFRWFSVYLGRLVNSLGTHTAMDDW
jgi:uncharacterized protein YegL